MTDEIDVVSSAALKARARRIAKGTTMEAKARKRTSKASLQGMLQLPLLEALEDAGGRARPRDLYETLANRLAVPEDLRGERRTCGDGQTYNRFEQQVRWARQTAVLEGLVADSTRGIWELADPGHAKLLRARRGIVLLIYSTDLGVALWGAYRGRRVGDRKGIGQPHPDQPALSGGLA